MKKKFIVKEKYRKEGQKPIEAVQWLGNNGTEMGNFLKQVRMTGNDKELLIHGQDGDMRVKTNDWAVFQSGNHITRLTHNEVINFYDEVK